MALDFLLKQLEDASSKELSEFLDENLDTSNNNWWQYKVVQYLSPQQKFSSQKDDIYSLDLNSLISVFCQNYVDFLTNKIFRGYELRNLAQSVRSIRNTVAHKSSSTVFTSDTIIYFLITYKLFLRKIHELNNVDNLNILNDITQELLSQMSRYFEVYDFEPQKNNSDYKNDTNDDQDNYIDNKDKTSENDLEDTNELIQEPLRLTKEEAKDLLIGLRMKINRKYPGIPRENNILRIKMIEFFIDKKINNKEKFNNYMSPGSNENDDKYTDLYKDTDERQLNELENIYEVISKINY